MSEIKLPLLPEQTDLAHPSSESSAYGYTQDDMHAYAREAIKADRAQPTAQPTAQAAPDERKAFEMWAGEKFGRGLLGRTAIGDYESWHTNRYWRVWQARAALPPGEPQQGRKPLSEAQVLEMCGDANRGFCIEFDEYLKAVRDTEQAHGISASKGDTNADD